jgi:hypothetical protein
VHAGSLHRKERVATEHDKASAVGLADPVDVIDRIRRASRILGVSVVEQVGGCASGDIDILQCRGDVLNEGQQRDQARIGFDLSGRHTGIIKLRENLRCLCKRLPRLRIDEVLQRLP